MIFCFLPCPREWALSLVAITTTPFSFLPFLLLFYCEIEFSVGGKEEEKNVSRNMCVCGKHIEKLVKRASDVDLFFLETPFWVSFSQWGIEESARETLMTLGNNSLLPAVIPLLFLFYFILVVCCAFPVKTTRVHFHYTTRGTLTVIIDINTRTVARSIPACHV